MIAVRFRLICAVAGVAVGQQNPDAELAKAVKNPYDLARFIDTHAAPGWDIKWNPATRRLTVQPNQKRMGDQCPTEMITIPTPQQAILVVECEWSEDYIRYTRGQDGAWRCEGTWGSSKYPRDHHVDRTSGTPFLRVLHPGNHGGGLDEETETWFDLTQPGFDPVFWYSPKGWEAGMGSGIGRTISSQATVSKNQISEARHIDFTMETEDGEVIIESRSPIGVFTRTGSAGAFHCRAVNDGMSCADFKMLADLSERGPSEEDLLRVCVAGLRKIARGPEDASKKWLRAYVSDRRDTPEVRELKALLR